MPKSPSADSSDRAKLWYAVLLASGVLTWALTMVKSGMPGQYGLGFWGANGHDGIWHLALAGQLAKGNFVMPTFAGAQLQNYHLGFDLLLAVLTKLTRIPLTILYFQLLPPLFALLVGVLTHRFVLRWRGNWQAANWALFFVYFGGSFGWIVNLVRGNSSGGESMFWAQQAVSSLINPPFALSLIVSLFGLIMVQNYIAKQSTGKYLLAVVSLGLLIQIKVYAGLLMLTAFVVVGAVAFWKSRQLAYAKIFIGVFIVSLALFWSSLALGSQLVVLKPFWFLENMMGLSDRLNWPRFFSAMVNYKLAGNWAKAVLAYGIALVIFWYGNMGTRVFSEYFAYRAAVTRRPDAITVILYSLILVGGAVPLLFLQVGTPWNTIQFLYYSLFFSGIVAGVVVGEGFGHSQGKMVRAALVILTLPTSLLTLKDVYIPSRPPAALPVDEIAALSFLATQPDGVVLTYPFDKLRADAAVVNPPRPLYLYDSTAYVSAFSGQQTFLEDEVNLTITNYPWLGRRQSVEQFYMDSDQNSARKFLRDNNIRYVYWVDGQRALLGESQLGLSKIYENSGVSVFEVK